MGNSSKIGFGIHFRLSRLVSRRIEQGSRAHVSSQLVGSTTIFQANRVALGAQDALDSVEFVTGSASSKWGKVRAEMGRREPWQLPYLAIGNEVRLLPAKFRYGFDTIHVIRNANLHM